MWMTVLIAGGLFAALLAMLWLNLADAERRREEERAAADAPAAGAQDAQCLLCEAPLRPHRTSDEVVVELERRIEADLAEIAALPGAGRPPALHLPPGRGHP